MSQASNCVNCDRAIDAPGQKYCPACGQPTPAHRIDWHFLGHELEHSILHMDRGILYTLKNLMLRPGVFIRDYIEGRRAHHVRPLLLIMLMAAVVVLLSKLMLGGDILNSAAKSGFSTGVGIGEGGATSIAAMSALFETIVGWANRNYAMATLILLPIEAAALKLAFKRFRNLNYPEWLAISAFLTVQVFLIQAVFIPLDAWLPGRQQWATALGVVYNIISLMMFFAGYPRWKSMLRTIAGLLLYQLAASLMMVVVLVVMLLWKTKFA